MTEVVNSPPVSHVTVPDISGFDAIDIAVLDVLNPVTNEPIGWRISFAGPGHPKTIAMMDRAIKRVRVDAARAAVSGRNTGAREDDKNYLQMMREGAEGIAARIVDWTPIRLGGEDLSRFDEAMAIRVLSDPRREWLRDQAAQFLRAEDAFMQASKPA